MNDGSIPVGDEQEFNGTKILVVMQGGVIQNIVGIPENCVVTVRDYDVEGCDLEDYL